MEKENWISEILDSTSGITKVTPHEMLFSKIQGKIKKREVISPQWVLLAAASLAILLLLNARIVFQKTKNTKAPLESIASSLSSNNQLY